MTHVASCAVLLLRALLLSNGTVRPYTEFMRGNCGEAPKYYSSGMGRGSVPELFEATTAYEGCLRWRHLPEVTETSGSRDLAHCC